MKLGALGLVLLASISSARAESPPAGAEVVSVERASVVPTGSSAAVEVAGGCWLSERRCVLTAQEIERLRAENESLRRQAGDKPFKAVVVALLLGLGAGFAVANLATK